MRRPEQLSQSLLKRYTKLTQKKYRQSEQLFLIEGTHLIREALNANVSIEAILATKAYTRNESFDDLEAKISARNVPLYEITERHAANISDAVASQGIIGIVKMVSFLLEDVLSKPAPSIIVALDNVSDPGNAGTILRTCDWFGVDAVVLGANSVELYNPKVVRSTMGSLFHLPIITEVDLHDAITKAKKSGYSILVTSSHGRELPRKFPPKSFIVFGNEAHGISEFISKEADIVATIPKYGNAESLNVAISCGIILSAMRNR